MGQTKEFCEQHNLPKEYEEAIMNNSYSFYIVETLRLLHTPELVSNYSLIYNDCIKLYNKTNGTQFYEATIDTIDHIEDQLRVTSSLQLVPKTVSVPVYIPRPTVSLFVKGIIIVITLIIGILLYQYLYQYLWIVLTFLIILIILLVIYCL